MSSDEEFLVELFRALRLTKLEAIVVGATAAVLHGAPLMTQDVDLLVRDTPTNRRKLRELAERLSATWVAAMPSARILTLVGAAVQVDVIFDRIPGRLTFESLRSRSVTVTLGKERAQVATLEDVIRSKEAANRPKDAAQLTILRDAKRVRDKL